MHSSVLDSKCRIIYGMSNMYKHNIKIAVVQDQVEKFASVPVALIE